MSSQPSLTLCKFSINKLIVTVMLLVQKAYYEFPIVLDAWNFYDLIFFNAGISLFHHFCPWNFTFFTTFVLGISLFLTLFLSLFILGTPLFSPLWRTPSSAWSLLWTGNAQSLSKKALECFKYLNIFFAVNVITFTIQGIHEFSVSSCVVVTYLHLVKCFFRNEANNKYILYHFISHCFRSRKKGALIRKDLVGKTFWWLKYCTEIWKI